MWDCSCSACHAIATCSIYLEKAHTCTCSRKSNCRQRLDSLSHFPSAEHCVTTDFRYWNNLYKELITTLKLLCRLLKVFEFTPFRLTPLSALSVSGVCEDSSRSVSQISGVGQRESNSLHSFNSLASEVGHLVGLNLAPAAIWVNVTVQLQTQCAIADITY